MYLLARLAIVSVFLSFVSTDSGEPKIKPFHFTGDLRLGMRESVHCAVVDGDPPFDFSWFKDGRSLVDLHGISVRKTDDFTSNLVISKVNAESNGNYTCRASNSNGYDEKSAVLSVRGPGEPKIKSFHFSNELESGMRESVHCNVLYGDTPFEFSWFKDGKPLVDGQGISIRKMDDYDSKLVVLKVDADSNGNYTCKVSNSKGFDEKSALLLVKDSMEPNIKDFHFSNNLELGMREAVHCIVTYGDPPFEFSWLKDGRPLAELRDTSVHQTDNFMSTLVISKVNADSNGNYTCRVSNKAGFDEKSAVLSVKDSGDPRVKSFHFSNVLELGMRESVQCAVMYGDPPFEFMWYKDGQKLVEGHGISPKKIDDFTSTLVISKVDADSNGNYTCRVSNSVGFDEKSATLSVKVGEIVNNQKAVKLLYDFGMFLRKANDFIRKMAILLKTAVLLLFVSKSVSSEVGAPKINPFHFSGELDIGMRASVQCAVIYGDPPFQFSWFKDGRKLLDSHGVSIGKFDDFTSNLVITKVDAESNGNYTCKVSNSRGTDEKSALLYVKDVGVPKISPFHFPGELDVGMRTSVLCAVIYGDPPFAFVWYKDGQTLSETRSVSIKIIDDFTSNLVVSKVDAESNGNYTCKASNSKGFDEKSALLSVKGKYIESEIIKLVNTFSVLSVRRGSAYWKMAILVNLAILLLLLAAAKSVMSDSGAPKVKSFHFSNVLELGMREMVHCIVMFGEPPFDFTWYKDGQKLAQAPGVSIAKFDEFTSSLVISKVDADSNGNYTCRASNSQGYDEKSAILSVKEKGAPKINPFHFSGELDVGMRASVQCAVIYGNPPFEFSWSKDDKKLMDNHGVFIRLFDDFTSTLVISEVDANSNGNYTCRASNSKGFDERFAVLSVKGRCTFSHEY
ncbi:Titin [Araneus ventricosus]|uniref:Titin n=1 Tax=Araneus ventricosus TaxID=182803 RepID=A0A4Y2EUJ4_ARAVE|nr:Titin [Araneus ventricosus]